MSDDKAQKRDDKAQKIVDKHVWWAAGAGLVPVPYLDMAAIAAVDLKMIKALTKTYEIDWVEERAKAIITSLTGGVATGMLARSVMLGTVIRMIPVIGQGVSMLSMPIFGGAVTYALGKVFAQHLAVGGTLLDLDLEKARKAMAEAFEKGKEAVLAKRGPKAKASAA